MIAESVKWIVNIVDTAVLQGLLYGSSGSIVLEIFILKARAFTCFTPKSWGFGEKRKYNELFSQRQVISRTFSGHGDTPGFSKSICVHNSCVKSCICSACFSKHVFLTETKAMYLGKVNWKRKYMYFQKVICRKSRNLFFVLEGQWRNIRIRIRIY